MVSPQDRREQIALAQELGLSQRKACGLIQVSQVMSSSVPMLGFQAYTYQITAESPAASASIEREEMQQ